jgi:hypothetical protein
VAREQVAAVEKRGDRVVHCGRRLAEADGHQPDLARILRDVAGGVHPVEVGRHRSADDDAPIRDLEAP